MQLDIITPDKKLYSGQAKSVYVPGIDGSLGVLENHAPLITTLKAGDVRIEGEHGKENFTIKGGVLEVLHNKVIILAE
jgi:F-type H+-transporting ATPase subunit epsilon